MEKKYNSSWHSLILSLFFVVAAFGGGFYLGQGDSAPRSLAQNIQKVSETEEAFNFNIYWETWGALKEKYFDKNKLNDRDIFYGSLRGLVEAAEDPYTVFMTPEETKEFNEDMSGVFEGIGAEVGMRDETITIIAPLAGMPAEKAGLKAGDKVYAIDGESALGLSVDQAVKKIRGPKETSVTLTVIRDGETKTREITIERGLIIIESVKTELRSDGIMVITVSNFNDDTELLFKKAVADTINNKAKGLILDLRNNPGGYLDTAILMASEWIEEGPVLLEQNAAGRSQEYGAEGLARLDGFPTVVLINGGSASASEIVAGALRDYHKATLVGEPTFGKGSVQQIEDLSDGSSLKVTVATWMTPDGDYINEKGLEPDELVELTNEDFEAERDPQFTRALEILKKK
ncbi:S41 family peptidase [Candidatus Falkowbacteria bacterium]|nr:S41 family peptidase [Patescibacteria group bacterium]MDD3435376.1 S41 family peptidase [Patescibacteria group bacterium]MDD4466645.1 S41 family peptidase [Patescibacteria group bacterium]NCU42990.1 S41 family peptidase [Candidatus Falkowbacteria bacterium]